MVKHLFDLINQNYIASVLDTDGAVDDDRAAEEFAKRSRPFFSPVSYDSNMVRFTYRTNDGAIAHARYRLSDTYGMRVKAADIAAKFPEEDEGSREPLALPIGGRRDRKTRRRPHARKATRRRMHKTRK
jgi:hypothetical protein